MAEKIHSRLSESQSPVSLLYSCYKRRQQWSEGESVTPLLEPLTLALQQLTQQESKQENLETLVRQIRNELTYSKTLLFLASIYETCVHDYDRGSKYIIIEQLIDRIYKRLLERQKKHEEAMKGYLSCCQHLHAWNAMITMYTHISSLTLSGSSLLTTPLSDSFALLITSYLAPVYYHIQDYANATMIYQKLIALASAQAQDTQNWLTVARYSKSQSECYFALNRLGAALRTIDVTLEMLEQKCGVDETPIVTTESNEIEKCWLECVLLKSEVLLSFQSNSRLCVVRFSSQTNSYFSLILFFLLKLPS